LLKLYYSIHNSIRICKRGVVAAYPVVWECVVEQWLGVRRTTHTILMQLGNLIDVFLARHVSGTYAHHQEH